MRNPSPHLLRSSMASLHLHSPFRPRPRPIKSPRGSHQKHLTSASSPLNSPSTAVLSITDDDDRTRTHHVAERADLQRDRAALRSYSSMLQTCASSGSLIDGKTVHARLLRTGVDPDTHLWDSLVNMYSKCGRIQWARRVFDEMPTRDVVAWTALMAGYTSEDNGEEGVRLFREMKREGISPNGFALASGLKASSLFLDFDFGQQLHGEATKTQFLSDLFVGSSLVDLYVKCGETELAEKVFFSLPDHNVVLWNSLFNGYARAGDERKVLEIFPKVMESETRLSKFTLSIVLKCCAGLGDLRQGQGVHSLVIKIGLELDGFLSSSLVDMYSKCGQVEDAHRVFVRIKDPDVVVWSAMISCFDQQGFGDEAVELFRTMRRKGVKPNQFTLASVASVASELGDQRFCGIVHAYILKSGFMMETTVGNAILDMYMKSGAVRDGLLVFDAMVDRDTISWNALLSGFHQGSCCGEGLRIFNQMLTENLKPNKYTFISVLRSCTSLMETSYGAQVHAHILKNSLHGDSFVGTALTDMYANCGHFNDACLVFNMLKERDVFAWTVIITGYTKNDQGEEAIKCYRQMQREGVSPNEFTLSSCLRACSNLAALDSGLQLHSSAIKSGQCDVFVSSALVDMYVKCGCLKDGESVFNGSNARDVVSWNTIICGYSQHGYGEKALETFQCMIDGGERPDEVTFIGVLSACSHVGLLDEGRRHFDSLSRVYEITPTIEHHACMIDILGRAGMLDEAERLVDDMTLTPDASIWQTILGACRMHGNVRLGERAANKLFELEPLVDSNYVLLSNTYAASARWSDVARVRTMMSSRGVKKEPGCSWIVADGQVHVFLAQDGSHTMAKEIYSKLKELTEEMTSAGYIPNTEHVLHDVSDGEKKEILLYHSERLALAYGLISTKSINPIRIFKNLRICGDCHNAIKVISSITSREFIIRDISRFHHFQNGSCSCQDYW